MPNDAKPEALAELESAMEKKFRSMRDNEDDYTPEALCQAMSPNLRLALEQAEQRGRKTGLEEAAQAICYMCRGRESPRLKEKPEFEVITSQYWHYGEDKRTFRQCQANAIRALKEKPE